MKPFASGILACLSIGLMTFAVSCVKNTTPPVGETGGNSSSDSSNGSYLSSIRSNSPLSSLEDSFVYDHSNRLTEIMVIGGDSSGVHPGATATVTFSYSGSSTAPASYTINNPNANSSLHQLSYDGQNRIAKDSALDGTELVTSWSYPNGNIASLTTGGSNDEMIDTLFLSKGNVVANHRYIVNAAGMTPTFLHSTQYTYTTIANPCYHPAIANTYGPLLSSLVIDGGFTDFISGNGISTADKQTFTWTTDSKGRAATLKVSAPIIGTVANLTFSYY
jgi:hypothetical protein